MLQKTGLQKTGLEKTGNSLLQKEHKEKPSAAAPGSAFSQRLASIGMVCFYLGLLLELLIVVVEKSAYTNPLEGQLFRLTFLLFAVKTACNRFTARQWMWMVFFGVIAGLCYLSSGRDEAVRLVVFCAAFKDVDLKKTLKLAFWVTLSGCAVLILLALTGIFGNMYIVDDGDRGIRYCFGLGHPNAFYCMFWVLTMLGICLYHEKMKRYTYLLLAAAGILLFLPTNSRTGVLILFFTLAGSFLLNNCPRLREEKWVCALGIAALVLCTGLSIWMAGYEPYQGPFYPYDKYFTGRITSMNTLEGGGGILRNWSLFSRPENNKYFDMGYVRLFYWYGVIPGAIYLAMYGLLMRQAWKRGDHMGFLMLTVFVLYSMLEAHFISVYLGRNYALFLMGAYWTQFPGIRPRQEKQAREGWFWQIPHMLMGRQKNVRSSLGQ